MATFDLAKEVESVEYRGDKSPTGITIIKVEDGKSGSVLDVGDLVTVTYIHPVFGEDTFTAELIGTMSVTVSGQEKAFMVLESTKLSVVYQYVVGLKADDAPIEIVRTGNSANLTAESFTVCFFPGTLIATPFGERKVEELTSGDLVLIGGAGTIPATWLGRKFARSVSIKWIGRQTVSTLFGPAERRMPVRFDIAPKNRTI